MNRLEQLKNLLTAQPDEPFLLFALAKEYENLKEDNLALEQYQKLVSNHPEYVGTYFHYGKILEKNNQLSYAIETYNKGVQVALSQNDNHSANELRAALFELEED